jgi:small conductance mechanosensitive channel
MPQFITDFLNKAGSYALYSLLPALAILIIGLIIVKLVIAVINKVLLKTKLEKAALTLIRSVIRVVLYLLLVLIVASALGIDVTGVIALASVLTLAVSLAVQDALTNLVGGFTLLCTKPFSSGDYVEIAGLSGSVQEIGLTYTKLLTPDSKVASIPNKSVVSAEIVNYTVSGLRRVDISISASYDSPIEKVLTALQEAAQVSTRLEDRPVYTAVSSYGDNAINYILQIWTTADQYWPTMHTVNKRIQESFEAHGVSMTYPHLNVHLDK